MEAGRIGELGMGLVNWEWDDQGLKFTCDERCPYLHRAQRIVLNTVCCISIWECEVTQ